MELYILRHGIAEEGRPGESDSERRLTPDGRKKLRRTLKLANKIGVAPSLILTSPYVRAYRTAEIAAEFLNYRGELLHTEALLPSVNPSVAWDEIRLHQDETQVLLCGHEPQCSALTAFLLGTPDLQVDFKKGAIVRIDIESLGAAAPRGTLKWFLAPKMAEA